MRPSRVLREIAEGKLASCLKSNLADPRVTEMAGMAGFSAIWLCNEHVPGDWITLEHCVRAAKLHDLDVIVRISKGSYSDYVKPLECDATGIMVPHVASAEEARNIVDLCRFGPLGRRALDGGNTDGAFCRLPIEEYLAASNREKFIILQIESPEAVEAVDEIAAVQGYNFLLFGPGDYSHRIGKPGRVQDPEVLAARQRVEAAALKHGKRGFAVGANGTPQELLQRGYAIANLASDVTTLNAGFDRTMEAFRSQMPECNPYYDRRKTS